MIITRQKEFNELLSLIKEGPVFIIGCSECATLCHTGGEEEVLSMMEDLKKKNIETTGWVILEPACHLLNDKRLLKQHKAEIDKAKKILVFACGNGAQTVSEIITDIDVIPGNDTLFLGEIKRASDFEKRCVMCGDCIQDLFEGVCPISRCPKSLLNGPCGGSIDGKCEVDKDIDCIWDIIYKRLKEKGQLDRLKKIREPKKWSKSTEMRRVL
ncbi:MAG: methylenetetrahydrofolate reductase C-terminal domain-containing protein [Thermoplasmatales archaeon]|nr:methylenetetrahydrofolate reductase C-terminal domain-containing protein [Thermoplasmatales archaeon]